MIVKKIRNLYHPNKIAGRFVWLFAGLCCFYSFALKPASGLVAMQLNLRQDSVFCCLDSFNRNDSLVFSNPSDRQTYQLVNYELRLLARPKELYHNIVRGQILPKSEIARYYENADNTVSVFFSDIRIKRISNGQILRAKPLKVKILKKKSGFQ